MRKKSKPLSFLVIFAMLITMMAPVAVFAEDPGVPGAGDTGNPAYTIKPDTTDGALLMSEFLTEYIAENVLEVDDDYDGNEGPNKFKTIQEAIAAAEPGTIINVAPGTYSGDITINNKNLLTINGPNAGKAGSDSRRLPEAVLKNSKIIISGTSTVTIDGFHIYRTDKEQDTVYISSPSAEATIKNSIIERNGPDSSGRGITMVGNAKAVISNNLFTGNDDGGLFGGNKAWYSAIYSNGGTSANVQITNNVFTNNRTAINLDNYSSGVVLSGNIFDNNGTHLSFGGSTALSGSFTLGENEFGRLGDAIINLSNVNPDFRLDISDSTFGGKKTTELSLEEKFALETGMYHSGRFSLRSDGSIRKYNGLVTYVDDTLFVAATNPGIQAAIDYAKAGDTIYVAPGVFTEEVVINKPITLKGAGMGKSYIVGPKAKINNTNTVSLGGGSILEGFTITREGNNLDDWAGNQRDQGVSFISDGNTLKNCEITGNRNGVYVNNRLNNKIINNIITNNRTGIQLCNNVTGLVVKDNVISNNWTIGILFNFDGPSLKTANVSINNNKIFGNWYGQVENRFTNSTAIMDLTGNWFGSAEITKRNTNSVEPGYAELIPKEFGGDATPPGTAFVISGTASDKINYDPWYTNEAMTDLVTDRPVFNTTKMDTYDTIQEAIDEASPGDVIRLAEGIFDGPITVSKNVTIVGAGKDKTVISGPAASGNPRSVPATVTLTASGTADKPVKFKDLQILGGHGIKLNSTQPVVEYLTLENVSVKSTSSSGDYYGINLDPAVNALKHLTITGSEIEGFQIGILLERTKDNPNINEHFTITDTVIKNNRYKGFYAESLTDSVFTNVRFIDNGVATPVLPGESYYEHAAGLDINLKYGDYKNLTFNNITVSGNGLGTRQGAGMMIKARDDGGYASQKATLINVAVIGGTFTGNERGIRFGEPGQNNAGPANVVIRNAVIKANDPQYGGPKDGLVYGAIINLTESKVDAGKNWFGTAEGSAIKDLVYGDVEYDPWYASSAMDILASNNKVINVTKGESYATVQAAINAASTGDIITVAPGMYDEKLTINKSVELRGAQYGVDARNRNADPVEESIIACTNPGEDGSVYITADNVAIDGFTFAPANWPGRINPSGNNIEIRNNIIRQVIYLADTVSDLTISNNWFKDIAAGSAISSDSSDEPFQGLRIVNNMFSDIDYSAIILGSKKYRDTVVSGNAIYRTGSQGINLEGDHSGTEVSGNYIEKANMNGGKDKGGIRIYGSGFSGTVKIENNTVVDSFNGFAVKDGEDITGKDIIVKNNNLIDNSNFGIYNGAAAGAIDATGNYWGASKPVVYGNVSYFPWYVDAGKTRLSNSGYNLTSPGQTSGTVTLSWTGIPGADGYNIYLGASTTPVNSSPITGTSYVVTGLSPSTTYGFTLKVIVDETEYAVSGAELSVTTNPSGGSGGGSGGGGSGGGATRPQTPQTPPPAPAALQDPETPDDQKLIQNLASSGNASLDLSGSDNNKAGLSADIVTQLAQEKLALTIENEGLQVNFAPNSLITPELQAALSREGATVEIGARQITKEEKQEILANAPLGESTGIFEIGGIIVDLTANIVAGGTSTKIEEFSEPVAVTIDLSGLNLTPEQISQLSGVRYEKDADGNIIPVPLGGTYDPVTKTFTFYTTKFSLYSVVRVPNLVSIEMVIGNNVTKVNGTDKNIDVPPYIINGRTMVPLRYIGEALGAEFEWDGKTRTVTFTLDGKELKLVIDQLLPGMDVPAIIVGNRTMVPVRYVTETLGAVVTWFPSERKVLVVK